MPKSNSNNKKGKKTTGRTAGKKRSTGKTRAGNARISSSSSKKTRGRKDPAGKRSTKKKTNGRKKASKKKSTGGRRKKVRAADKKKLNSSDLFSGKFPSWMVKTPKKRSDKGSAAFKKVSLILAALFIVIFAIKTFRPALVNLKNSISIGTSGNNVTAKNSKPRTSIPKEPSLSPSTPPLAVKKYIPGPAVTPSRATKRTRNMAGPYIVFVIDDVGYTRKYRSLLASLGDNATYAILPHVPYSSYFHKFASKTGAETILHLPILSASGKDTDPGLLKPDMSSEEIVDTLRDDILSVGNCPGANNHKGSLGTSDERLMRIVLRQFKHRNMFFLDSYTTASSVVLKMAEQEGVPVLRRDIFLDNKDDRSAINRQITLLAKEADKKGHSIGIGHYRYNTLKVLNERIPELEEEGYDIICLSELIRLIKD